MGRTLHFSIKKETKFTRKDLEVIYNVSRFYNSDELLKDINTAYKSKLKELWTCENFWLGVGSFYPNWYTPLFKDKGSNFAWDYINKEIATQEKAGKHYIDVIEKLTKDKIVLCHGTNVFSTNEFSGFTKTQGNEFNSLLVFQALLEISKKIPTAIIELSDEGEFLLCPLKIQKGKVLPIISDLINSIEHFSMKMLFSKGFAGNILDRIKPTDFSKEFSGDLNINNSYGDMTDYINDKLRNLKEIEKALIKAGLLESNLYLYNIKNRELKDWFEPELFVRPVEVERFLDYKSTPEQMMDGFHGEGFDLTTEDSKKESLEHIAKMMKLLGGLGTSKDGFKMKIIGEDNVEE